MMAAKRTKAKMRFWLARDKDPDGVLTLFCGYAPFASAPGYWHSSDPFGGGTFQIESSDVAVEPGKRREVSATIDVNGVAVRPLKG
jgi:hypothetical protein